MRQENKARFIRAAFAVALATGLGACAAPNPNDALNSAQDTADKLKNAGEQIQKGVDAGRDLYNQAQNARATADAIVDKYSPTFQTAQALAEAAKRELDKQLGTPVPQE